MSKLVRSFYLLNFEDREEESSVWRLGARFFSWEEAIFGA